MSLGEYMSGTLLPLGTKTKVQSDVITESLLQPPEFGVTVETVLGVVFPALAVYLANGYSETTFQEASIRQFGRKQSRLIRPANLMTVCFGSLDQMIRCKHITLPPNCKRATTFAKSILRIRNSKQKKTRKLG